MTDLLDGTAYEGLAVVKGLYPFIKLKKLKVLNEYLIQIFVSKGEKSWTIV
jgi:hypothetical protein